jgi:hypothetical protein
VGRPPHRRREPNEVHVCDLGCTEGITPLIAPSATTPDCEPHTPKPSAYVAHSDWADQMAAAGYVQRKCKGCELWLIWEPGPSALATTAGEAPENLSAQTAARGEDGSHA